MTTRMRLPAEERVGFSSFMDRQFGPKARGTPIFGVEPKVLEAWVDEAAHREVLELGYADFAWVLRVKNPFPGIKNTVMKITDENRPLLRSAYESRSEWELPVLTRWFQVPSLEDCPMAEWLEVELYSKVQMDKEDRAKGKEPPPHRAAWSVVVIRGFEREPPPPQPITMMRNELGPQHGGSGERIQREAYLKAVEFWQDHAFCRL